MTAARRPASNKRRKTALSAFEKASGAHQRGQFDEALAGYESALHLDPCLTEARAGMTAILEMARSPTFNPRLAGLLEQCLAADEGNFLALSRPAAHQIRLRYGITKERPHLDLSPRLASELARDPLLLLMLEKTYNMDGLLEACLTGLRRQLLAMAQNEPFNAAALTPLVSAIALQAFNNEYVFFETEDESESAAQLATAVAAEEAFGEAELSADFEIRTVAAAMYRPLAEMENHHTLASFAEDRWSPWAAKVVRRTLVEPLRERNIRADIQRFGEISDETSNSVGTQYEANPYPRWLHLPLQPKVDILAALRRDFPATAKPPSPGNPLRILSAGCGTGQHPLTLSRSYKNVHVTGIDLSASSLAYAERMAEHLNIRNARFLQGDLLSVARLDMRFDLIESIGVLHHMADPFAGWLSLIGALKPGGIIRIALYGQHARRDIVEARRRIAALGIADDTQGIRAFRRMLFADPAMGDLKDLTDWDDFYSTSNVRDLLFHVTEHQFTVEKIRPWVEETGMRFLGFEISAGFTRDRGVQRELSRLYRSEYPDDTDMTSLVNWQALEIAHPGIFEGYCFWCQKT